MEKQSEHQKGKSFSQIEGNIHGNVSNQPSHISTQEEDDAILKRVLLHTLNFSSICHGRKANAVTNWEFGKDYVPLTNCECSELIPNHYKHHILSRSFWENMSEFTFFVRTTQRVYLARVLKCDSRKENDGKAALHTLTKDTFISWDQEKDSNNFHMNRKDCNNIDTPVHSFISVICPGLMTWLESNGCLKNALSGEFLHLFHEVYAHDALDGMSKITEQIISHVRDASIVKAPCMDLNILEQWIFERLVALTGLQLALALKRLHFHGIAHRLVNASWKNGQVLAGMDMDGRVVLLSDSFSAALHIMNKDKHIPYVSRNQILVRDVKNLEQSKQPPEVVQSLIQGPNIGRELNTRLSLPIEVEIDALRTISEKKKVWRTSTFRVVFH